MQSLMKREDTMQRSLMKRAAAVVAVAMLILLGGAAAAQAKTEIHFWHAMGGQLGETVNELVKQFNQSQAEYEVKPLNKGTYPEVLTSAIAAYRQKNPPHIVQVFEVGTQTMLLSGAIIPTWELMKQQEIAVNWDDFIGPVTGYYSKDGKLYSMPFNSSTPILYYNKDAFKKARLAADKPPARWKEVEDASRKILAAGAAKCGFTTSWPSWTMLENTFAWHNQPFATNDNGYKGLDTKLLINSDFGQMHIGALARWQTENVYSYGGRMGQPEPKFINGECAMVVASSALIGGFKKSVKFDWGTGPLPHWSVYRKQNTIVGGATLWVMKGQKATDYKGVARFMKFLAEPHQQMWWAVTTGYVPITKTAVKNLEEGYFFKKNPEQWTAMSTLLHATPTPNSLGIRLGNFVQIRDGIEAELENIFAGKKTAKEGLDAAVAKGNEILKEFAAANKP